MRVILDGSRVVGIEVILPGIPPGPNQQRGQHWGRMADTATFWKGVTTTVLREATRRAQRMGHDPHFPWPAADVEVTFRYTTANRRDVGNLIASLKPVLDGLPLAGVIKDDSYMYLDEVRAVVQRRLAREREIVILIRRCRHLADQVDLGLAAGGKQ
jgi:Holliday junction resolvase RusA-like endonuclease